MYMIKRLFVCLLAAAVLMVGCAGNIRTRDIPETVQRPDFIERLEENTNNSGPGDAIKIIDWRKDDVLLWVWIDNKGMEGSCDYVVILQIDDLDNDQYTGLKLINRQVSADPCASGYSIYGTYVEERDRLLEEAAKSKGI